MKKILLSGLAALMLAAPASAQFSNVTPTTAGANVVNPADDFATRAFQDPWDMSQRTDVGWWLFSNDFPRSQWTAPTFANGRFSGTTITDANGAANLFLLESGIVPTPGGTATPIGKTGQQYPIDANKYTHILYRMSSSTGFFDTGQPSNISQFIWSTDTIYQDQTIGVQNAGQLEVIQGNAIYAVDLRTLTTVGTATPWSGTKRALKFLPNSTNGAGITIDWIRLVDASNAALFKTINWTGGVADIYLDNDNDPANGTLGRIAINATSGRSFFFGGLEAGDYYIALHTHTNLEETGPTGFTYSAGFYRVGSIPTLSFTTPSEEGSSEDFATTRLGNPWNFNSLTDIDFKSNIHGDGITQLALTDLAGNSLGNQTVYLGVSDAATPASGNVGDSFLFPLFWDGRGKVTQIDPARYRILTVEHGIPDRARDLNLGSVARVVWRAVNEPTRGADGLPGQTVGAAYFFNHKAGENTVFKTVLDMKDMPAEPSPFSIGQSTWGSPTAAAGIDAFRFDPHEFDTPTPFFMKRIKLAALERSVSDVLTFRWTYSKASGTVSLFRQAAGSVKNFSGGTAIVSGTNAVTGSYAWNTSSVPDGEYQVYAIFTDGTSSNQVYAPTNIVVDHSNVEVATINLSRTQLNFATFGPVRTQAQIIRLTFSGSGDQCWTTTSSIAGMTISPSSGTGAAAIVISVTGNFAGGTTNGLINVQSCTNPSNSRAIAVSVTSLNSTRAPSGQMDTPAEGATVSGSIAVTGWATDDVEVLTVRICRDSVGDTTTPTLCGGQNKVYIGDAIFIDDARSDIELGNPSTPLNYRAGWGYLLLTNFLPNQGEGPVTLHAYAIDREGNVSLIGSKSIITNNFAATKPFGAIDTPGQGQAVCGTIVNFGWALTQAGKDILADSSTISVFVDDVFVGRPGARLAREDITAAFPTLDTSHAVGGFFLDTTTLANGVHTIYWIVSDNTGAADGIGSRFFTVSNPCTGG